MILTPFSFLRSQNNGLLVDKNFGRSKRVLVH